MGRYNRYDPSTLWIVFDGSPTEFPRAHSGPAIFSGPILFLLAEPVVSMRAILFSITLLFSSFLLFLVQPMIGRMLLPSLGGTPAVWNGCMVFFQAVLLGGYAWAHYGPSRLGMKNHMYMHLVLLVAVGLFLPIQLNTDWAVPAESNPMGWLFGQLTICVGLPFFVISSSAPLLQRWFSASTKSTENNDPWFLYAVSNVGSLAALVAYPFVFERLLGLTDQRLFWAIGFMVMGVLFVGCAWYTLRNSKRESLNALEAKQQTIALPWKKRLHYIVLAAIPSSLMLGVTTVVSTEVGSFPLMWSIPLALYLLTFVFVFAKRVVLPHALMIRLMPILLLAMPILGSLNMCSSPIGMLSLYFGTFFVTAMVCHGELARLRPDVSQLTEFYLMMSIGGVVGGIINSLVAPVLFTTILEFPLMLIAACLVLPGMARTTKSNETGLKHRLWIAPAVLAGMLLMLWVFSGSIVELSNPLPSLLVFGIPALICFTMADTPRRFAFGFAVMIFVCPYFINDRDLISRQRGFFGVNEIASVQDGKFRMLVNGRTMHGLQRSDQFESPDPLTYYHRQGPIGDVFALHGNQQRRVAVVGLGIGTIAAYSQPGQTFDFFEIDPVVCEIAQDQRYFNFLSSSKGRSNVILGDARIQLDVIRKRNQATSDLTAQRTQVSLSEDAIKSQPADYGLIVLDAFGSDSVPLHLLTVEAIELYLDLLDDHGLLAIHITSNFMDFEPVGVGITNSLGLHGLIRFDHPDTKEFEQTGRASSRYMLIARDKDQLKPFLNGETGWQPLNVSKELIWTDEHANVLDAMKW